MGSFWETFDKMGNKLDGIGEVLEDVNDTYATTQHGYHKVKNSKKNYDRVVQRLVSGKNTEDFNLAVMYFEKTKACKKRTVWFCIIAIIITIVICICV